MNQVNQGESSSGPSVNPVKRSRGRPRKDPSLKRTGGTRVRPGFEGAKEFQPQRADRTDGVDSMVGKAVTGVVEAAFDAGYMLTVRIGDSPINLRGVVFKPGHYVPITAENDVAPHLQMIRRNDVQLPAENQGRSHHQKVAIQTVGKVPSKRKRASPKMASSAPPVGVKGTVVPVVKFPIAANLMPSDSSQSAHVMAFGDKDVHMVEPLSMLPPDRSRPVGQMFLGTQPLARHQVSQRSGLNDNKPFKEGTSGIGQGKNIKPVESTDPDSLSETPDTQTEIGKEALKSTAETSGTVSKKETGNTHKPISTGFLQTAPVTKPLLNFAGRMTELLQALQQNMTENQVQIAEQPPTASKIEFGEPVAKGTDPNNEPKTP